MILKETVDGSIEVYHPWGEWTDSKPLALFTESIVTMLTRPSAHQAFVDLVSLMGQTFPISAPAMYVNLNELGTSIYSVLDPKDGGTRDTNRMLEKMENKGNYSYFKVKIGGHPPVLKERVDMAIIQKTKASVLLSINSGTHEYIFRDWVKILAPAMTKLIDNEQLKNMAFKDSLTGLFNHRAFEQMLAVECDRVFRYGDTFSLIMLDIDWFKDVNDRYGHQAGDKVLRAVADKIKESVRKSDMVFRYGGEEFMVIMPNTGISNALKLAERIRRNIERMSIIPGHKITLSQGLTQYKDGLSPSDLVRKADIALYEAKNKGKNRIEVE